MHKEEARVKYQYWHQEKGHEGRNKGYVKIESGRTSEAKDYLSWDAFLPEGLRHQHSGNSIESLQELNETISDYMMTLLKFQYLLTGCIEEIKNAEPL